MDVVMKNYFLRSRYQTRCSDVFRTLFAATLLTTAPVLSTIMDTTTPTPKHGICTSLVSALCYFRQYSLSFPTRYDLRVLFDKAHGEFSVNVQALSRVRRICFPFLPQYF
jgi:hypothetical protein